MRKVRPQDVCLALHQKLDKLSELHSECSMHITAQHNAGLLIHTGNELKSLLSEQCMMLAAVAWEVFISELFVCYINRDSTLYAADLKKRFNLSIKERFGADLASKAVLALKTHLSKRDVKKSVDPKSYNLVVKDAAALVDKATAWLAAADSAKFVALSASDKATINAWREIRDYLAHESEAAWTDMEKALTAGHLPVRFRWVKRSRHDVGAYLRADPSQPPAGITRLLHFFNSMKDISTRLTT